MHRILALILIWLALGCVAPLGTDDVELEYRVDGNAQLAIQAVRIRLLAARVNAEVRAAGADVVAIRLASGSALAARRVLAWSGTLEVQRLDPTHVLAPSDATALTAREMYYSGPATAVIAAAITTSDATDRLVFELGGSEPRTWTVRRELLVELARGGARVEGTNVIVEIPSAIADGLLARFGDVDVALVVASQLDWHGRLRDCVRAVRGSSRAAIVIPRGDDLAAYNRARLAAKLLSTPRLPEMTLTDRRELPIDWPLALACTCLPVAIGLLWLGFVRRFDHARPEPWWLLLATFGLGIAAQRLAAFIELRAWHATPYLDHRLLARDHGASGFPISFAMCVLVVGCIEEGTKLLATSLATRRREFDEPIDGIVYAAAAAIGFAVSENLDYFTAFRLSDGIAVGRSLLAMPGHVMMSAIWGYALGQRLVGRKARVAGYFVVAAAVHGAWDTLLDYGARPAWRILLGVTTIAFVVLLRRALRWGPIEVARAEPTGERATFRVGRPAATAIAIAAMYAAGYVLIDLAYDADFAGQRLTWDLLARGFALGLLFVGAALVMVRMMPLDVAVDDHGITYAGALHRWRTIRRIRRDQMWAIALETDRGDVQLGPGAQRTMDALEAAVKKRLAKC